MDDRLFVSHVASRLCSDVRRATLITQIVFEELRRRIPTLRLPRLTVTVAIEDDGSLASRYRLGLCGELMQRAAVANASEAERAAIAVFAALRCTFDDVETAAIDRQLSPLPPDLDVLWAAAAWDRCGRTAPSQRVPKEVSR